MDQFRLYEGSRLLKIGPEGHQMGVKQRSAPSRQGRGLGHEQGGLYTQHVARGGLMGGQRRHMHTGMHMTAAWGL